jgi:hypothetical protein
MSGINNPVPKSNIADDLGTTLAPSPPQRKKPTPFTPPRNNLSDDELLAKTFIDLMQLKFDRGEFERIRREQHDRKGVHKVMRPGMIMGGISAVVTFVALRRLPKRFMNNSLAKPESFWHGRDGNPFYQIVRKQGPWWPNVKTNRDGTTTFREGWFLSPLFIAVDAVAACAMGCVVTVVATPKIKLFEAAADIPLTHGRSAISDTLCSDFIVNYKRLPKELWTPKKLKRDDVTTNIKRFVENCQRRQQMEKQLRSNAALSENEAVEIPYPGVPPNLILEVEESPDEVVVSVDRQRSFWLDDWAEEDDEDDLW